MFLISSLVTVSWIYRRNKKPEVLPETEAHIHFSGLVFWEAPSLLTFGCDIPRDVSQGDEVVCELE